MEAPPQQDGATSHPSPPPPKRVKLDTVNVTVGGESLTLSVAAFQKLETFLTDKMNSSDKKSRNPISKKQDGHYEIKRGADEFKVIAQYLEGRPLGKIRDVDRKKKILKEAKYLGFPDAEYEALSSMISLPTFKGAPERHFLKSTVEETCYETVCINKKFVVGAGPQTVCVWSTATKQLLHTLPIPRHVHRRHTLVVSRIPVDLSYLFAVSGSPSSTSGCVFTAWNMETGEKLLDSTLSSPSSDTTCSSSAPSHIAYRNNHVLVCVGGGKEVHFLRVDLRATPSTLEKKYAFTREGAPVSCCDFYQQPDGNFVAVLGHEDGNVSLYSLNSPENGKTNLIRTFEAHYAKDTHGSSSSSSSAAVPPASSAVTHVRMKRDVAHLVSSGYDGTVGIWDLAREAKILQRFDTGMKFGVQAMDIDDDDSVCIVGAAHDFNVRVFDLTSGEAVKTVCVDEKRSAKFDVHGVGYCSDFISAGVSDSRVRLLKWRRE